MDPDTLLKNTTIIRNWKQIYIVESLYYGEYVILNIVTRSKEGHLGGLHFPYKKTATGWLVSYDLDDDPTYQALLDIGLNPKTQFPRLPDEK